MKENENASSISENFVLVPERLAPGQNLLNQPPFTFLLQEKSIFPEDLFNSDKDRFIGFVVFMRFIFARRTRKPKKEVETYVNANYHNSIDYIKSQSIKYLDQYVRWKEYLAGYWDGYYDAYTGYPKNESDAVVSYVGYLILQKALDDNLTIQAIQENFSVDPRSTASGKKRANRSFRFYRSGAMQ